jgi:hypothetical protein
MSSTNEQVIELQRTAEELAKALRQLVNQPLPVTRWTSGYTVDLDPEISFWVACRNARATLDSTKHLTGINGEQDERWSY